LADFLPIFLPTALPNKDDLNSALLKPCIQVIEMAHHRQINTKTPQPLEPGLSTD
jgi:hypothetical protein